MGRKEKLRPIAADDACIFMHTALRKVADTPITAIAYEVIGMICNAQIKPRSLDPWRLYGKLVAESMNEVAERGEKLINPYIGCRFAWRNPNSEDNVLVNAWHERALKRRKESGRDAPDGARTALYALSSVFEVFSTKDWEAMATYFLPDEG